MDIYLGMDLVEVYLAMTNPRGVLASVRVKLFDRFGWFKKEFTSEYCNRGLFNYLISHPEHIEGKVGDSKYMNGFMFWNATGKEDAVMFPTSYFPKKWFEDLKVTP